MARPALIGFLILLAATTHADTIEFWNGDRLSGKLLSMNRNELRIATEVAGDVRADPKQVKHFETTDAVEIQLVDGTVVVGRIASEEPGAFRAEGAGGPATLYIADIHSIHRPAEPPPRWSGNIMAGADLERGNSQKNAAHVEARVVFRAQPHRVTFRGTYTGERTEGNGVTSTINREMFGEAQYDHFLSRKLFWFTRTSGEKDAPSDLDLRTVVGGGLGNQWFDSEARRLGGRVGLMWVREDFSDRQSVQDKLSALVSWDLEEQLNPTLQLFVRGSVLQSLEAQDDQLIKTEAGIRSDLIRGVFLEAKVVWEWDSEPAQNAERQDVDYIFGLGYRF